MRKEEMSGLTEDRMWWHRFTDKGVLPGIERSWRVSGMEVEIAVAFRRQEGGSPRCVASSVHHDYHKQNCGIWTRCSLRRW